MNENESEHEFTLTWKTSIDTYQLNDIRYVLTCGTYVGTLSYTKVSPKSVCLRQL